MSLRNDFDKLKSGDTSRQSNTGNRRTDYNRFCLLNMQAIQRKSKIAEKTAEEALTIIIAFGGIVFLIAFTFHCQFSFSSYKSYQPFTEAIKEIANKNYNHRIHIDNKDEFGKLG